MLMLLKGQSMIEHPPQDSNFNNVLKLLTETIDFQITKSALHILWYRHWFGVGAC